MRRYWILVLKINSSDKQSQFIGGSILRYVVYMCTVSIIIIIFLVKMLQIIEKLWNSDWHRKTKQTNSDVITWVTIKFYSLTVSVIE